MVYQKKKKESGAESDMSRKLDSEKFRKIIHLIPKLELIKRREQESLKIIFRQYSMESE